MQSESYGVRKNMLPYKCRTRFQKSRVELACYSDGNHTLQSTTLHNVLQEDGTLLVSN